MRLDQVISVVQALNEAGIRYLIVGGLAVNAHGHVRYTNDLDLVIGLESTTSVEASTPWSELAIGQKFLSPANTARRKSFP